MQIQPNLAAGNPQVAQLATPDRFGPLEVRPSKIVQAATERCFAWLGRNRRFAKDFEATIASATAFLYAASVQLLTRRLARSR